MPQTPANWTESRLQQEIFTWHHNTFPAERGLLYSISQNAHNRTKGAMNKAIGVVAGVSDMHYIAHGKLTCIELKLPDGRQSQAQKDWQRAVEQAGHRYYIVRSLEDFKALHSILREQNQKKNYEPRND